MIGYATVGTNDLDRALGFYDALLGSIGAKRLLQFDQTGFTMYGIAWGKPALAVTRPYDGGTATNGNGAMVAIMMDARAEIDAFYAKALELGGTDEGPPGLRGPEGKNAFYGAYFRDLDRNKFCVYRTGPA